MGQGGAIYVRKLSVLLAFSTGCTSITLQKQNHHTRGITLQPWTWVHKHASACESDSSKFPDVDAGVGGLPILGWDGEGGPHAERATTFKAVSGNPPTSFVAPLQGSHLSREGDPWARVASGHCDSWTQAISTLSWKQPDRKEARLPQTAHQPIPALRMHALVCSTGPSLWKMPAPNLCFFPGSSRPCMLSCFLPTSKGSLPCLVGCEHSLVPFPHWYSGWSPYSYLAVHRRLSKDVIHGSTPILQKQFCNVCIQRQRPLLASTQTFIYTET